MTTHMSCHFNTVGTPWWVRTVDTLIKSSGACVLTDTVQSFDLNGSSMLNSKVSFSLRSVTDEKMENRVY